MLARQRFVIVSERVFELDEVAQAHQLSQTGHGRGRIVMHISD